MGKKVKCPVCNTMNDKEETVAYGNRYYCKTCYEEKEQSVDGYKRLVSYICRLYNINKPTGMMLKQIKDFKNEYGFTDDGIYMTLRYYYELLDNKVLEGVGLGIVPYYYEKAKQQYLTLINVENMVENCEKDIERTVVINADIRNRIINNFRNKNINFDGIDWSELDE